MVSRPVLQRLNKAIDHFLLSYLSENKPLDAEEWFEDAPLYMRPWQASEQYCDAVYVPLHRFSPFPLRYEFLPLRMYTGDGPLNSKELVELKEDVDYIAILAA